MAGGLFEGLVRLYTEKDWWCKHLFFVAFAIITCLNELLKVPKNNASVEASFEFLGRAVVTVFVGDNCYGCIGLVFVAFQP